MPDVSLIVSFYNRVDYLRLVLAALKRQSFQDFQVIIADDGSTKDAVREIEKLSATVPFEMIHVWQEDHGFRKNKILNKAITVAAGNYLIFIDGDCIAHKEFVKEHYSNKAPKTCLTGRRVNLSEGLTNQLTPQKIEEGYLETHTASLIIDSIFGKTFDVEQGFYFRSQFLRRIVNRKKRGILGSNFSLYKADILSINGFDERYEEPGIGEDTDIQYRLELSGVQMKSLNNIAIQYHLYHELQERSGKNLELYTEVKASKQFFTPFGIEKSAYRSLTHFGGI
ncbi:MAG: glycosyltransferase [Bacteroidota bacterium]